MCTHRKFPAVFAGAKNGFIPAKFCFVAPGATKQCRLAKEDSSSPKWVHGPAQNKNGTGREPEPRGWLAGPPGAG
jgi:hypothetical protein